MGHVYLVISASIKVEKAAFDCEQLNLGLCGLSHHLLTPSLHPEQRWDMITPLGLRRIRDESWFNLSCTLTYTSTAQVLCVCECVSSKYGNSVPKSARTFPLSTLTALLRPSVFYGKASNKQLYNLFIHINMLCLLQKNNMSAETDAVKHTVFIKNLIHEGKIHLLI